MSDRATDDRVHRAATATSCRTSVVLSIRSTWPSRWSRARSSRAALRELPAQTWLWVCEPVVEIATQTEGDVPAYLPGEHPFKDEFASEAPPAGVRGARRPGDDVSGVPGAAPRMAREESAARGAGRRPWCRTRRRRRARRGGPQGAPPADGPGQGRDSSHAAICFVSAVARPRRPRHLVGGGAAAVTRAVAQQNQNFDDVQMDVQQVSGSVYMVVGAGGNTTVFTGPEGVLVVDTQFAPLSGKLIDAIQKLSDSADPLDRQHASCTAITSAATKRSPKPVARAPAATSSATSARRRRRRRASSRTRTC